MTIIDLAAKPSELKLELLPQPIDVIHTITVHGSYLCAHHRLIELLQVGLRF